MLTREQVQELAEAHELCDENRAAISWDWFIDSMEGFAAASYRAGAAAMQAKAIAACNSSVEAAKRLPGVKASGAAAGAAHCAHEITAIDLESV